MVKQKPINPIKRAREAHNLRQADIAEQLEVSISAVNRWEQWKTVPRLIHRKKLVGILKLTNEDFLLLEQYQTGSPQELITEKGVSGMARFYSWSASA
jgi:transcriptional regulator with XRE-family HTH domain